ncbi:ABC transporter ATP-binding protein [Agaribacterium sp. ZY112]|uniref:ABC transporter ATP-binding protein n=1 Tax=Agaribacterium sp. ZY112 TaxID=3233574 RepID=UPI0035245868
MNKERDVADIHLIDVCKRYKKGATTVVVHKDINLRIEPGEFVALMGPSGLGKSTLLNLMGGLDRPTEGNVLMSGVAIDTFSEAKLTRWRSENIGFVFQSHYLLPVLTARENVELPLALTNLNSKQRKQRAQIALQLVSMIERENHYPKELSGGQEQRVAIARAIVSDPKILLCDEPTGNLDRETADEILAMLKKINKVLGKTIVMVTHDNKASEYVSKLIDLEAYLKEAKANQKVVR